MNKLNFIPILVLFLIVKVIVGCSSSTDSYKPYVSEKIPIYPQKLDTILTKVKDKDLIFKLPKPPDPIVDKAAIFWNNESDSVKKKFQDNKDTLKIRIESLQFERDYSFNIYTLDTKGNKSVGINKLVTLQSIE